MFERFTEKAINVVSRAQEAAKNSVRPEHILLALVSEAKGISLKIFKSCGIDRQVIAAETAEETGGNSVPAPFHNETKELLKETLDLAGKSGNTAILYEHLFLALISGKKTPVKILEKYGFDVQKSKEILEKLVQKKIKRLSHPEIDEHKDSDFLQPADTIFDSEESSKVFERAVAKLSASNYEILGTEQVIASILEDGNSGLAKILADYGITDKLFDEKLSQTKSRQAEYEGKQVIFTPNAFAVMNTALQTAKELGSSSVLPEHIVLGLLKTKRGLAYNIFRELNVTDDDLAHSIIKPIEKQMPETLTILRFAKEEARRLGHNIVGTEMFLLGIICEGSGTGAVVLNDLGVNIKDARIVVENLTGFGDEYGAKEIIFTKRAKKALEAAWKLAKLEKKPKIESAHILLALINEPDSLAMKALAQLGADAVEIKEGINKVSREQ
ncbi:MAG: hypothetical protein LBK53_01190 [Heliobacteriaceae bacterium]|nr:hypothetical protein [Heliobacteriaceae bacterium]